MKLLSENKMNENGEKEIKITFRQKSATGCPICRTEFYREELFSGRGRLIAGELTEELRRLYEENKKYGAINPLIYTLTVCPGCFYASSPEDFSAPIKDVKKRLQDNTEHRASRIYNLFPDLDFNDNRELSHGVASYILAVTCYSFFEKKYAPSFKRAVSSIRAAWTLDDLAKEKGDSKAEYLKDIFYHKAAHFYHQTVEYSQNGKEIIDGIKHYGPDVDKNFGYDGMLYMACLLNSRLGDKEENLEKQAETYIKAKRIVSKLFGSGKASKEKPTAILDMARDVFREINEKLKNLEQELGRKLD